MDRFVKNIKSVERRDAGVIKRLDIDLSLAITDQEYGIAGNMFYIWASPDGTYIDIKINETRESAISYVEQTGQKTPFDKLYITTPGGQAGNLVLLYGTEAPELVEMLDNRGAISGDLATIRDELLGDVTPENWGEVTVGAVQAQLLAANVNRKAFWIDADPNNTGIVYLGFDNTVTTAAGGNNWCKALLASQGWGADDYRGPIHAIATAAGQLVGTGEW